MREQEENAPYTPMRPQFRKMISNVTRAITIRLLSVYHIMRKKQWVSMFIRAIKYKSHNVIHELLH